MNELQIDGRANSFHNKINHNIITNLLFIKNSLYFVYLLFCGVQHFFILYYIDCYMYYYYIWKFRGPATIVRSPQPLFEKWPRYRYT